VKRSFGSLTLSDFRASYAVIVGIDHYADGIPSLRSAVFDAEEIEQCLRDDHEYTPVSPGRLLDKGSLETVFTKTLPATTQVTDRLLVYFACHGIALDGDDGPKGFLLLQDARHGHEESFLPMKVLTGWLESLSCRHILLVLDCCFAGAIRWSSTRELVPQVPELYVERYRRYIADSARQVITSAAYDQKALDVVAGRVIGVRAPAADARTHSPFAQAFLRALKGEADMSPPAREGRPAGDGVMTATEIYQFLTDCTEVGEHLQTPGIWPLKKHDYGEYVFLVPGRRPRLGPAPSLDEASNPYRGLEPYEEQHESLFFGRKAFVDLLEQRVSNQPVTVVVGASGSGKSSAVKAGLLPRLRKQGAHAWTILLSPAPLAGNKAPTPIRPSRSPLAALASLEIPGARLLDAEARLARYRQSDEALADQVRSWASSDQSGMLVLVVDQFEELFTICADRQEREQFLKLLSCAVSAFSSRFRLVITLRSSFESQFMGLALRQWWQDAAIAAPAMSTDEYRHVILGPASARVLYFKPKPRVNEAAGEDDAPEDPWRFVNRMIDDLAKNPGPLPLLSFTLSELYRSYVKRLRENPNAPHDRSLLEADYDRLGGIAGSLRTRADEVYTRDLPTDAHRQTMRRIMLRMVSLEGGEVARRRVLNQELVYTDELENRRAAEVLRILIEARLVVEDVDVDGRPFVEPAHDELVQGWDRLREWSREDAEAIQLRRRVSLSAGAWERGDGSVWLLEPRLAILKSTLNSPQCWLNGLETRFIRRSLATRRALIVATIVVTVLAFSVISLFGWRAEQGRQRAELNFARGIVGRIGQDDGPVNPVEMGAFSDLAGYQDMRILEHDRLRELVLHEALATEQSALQLRARLEFVVHSAVELDLDRRRQVVENIVLPALRTRSESNPASNAGIRLAAAEMGILLGAVELERGEEFKRLAVAAIGDSLPLQIQPHYIDFDSRYIEMLAPALASAPSRQIASQILDRLPVQSYVYGDGAPRRAFLALAARLSTEDAERLARQLSDVANNRLAYFPRDAAFFSSLAGKLSAATAQALASKLARAFTPSRNRLNFLQADPADIARVYGYAAMPDQSAMGQVLADQLFELLGKRERNLIAAPGANVSEQVVAFVNGLRAGIRSAVATTIGKRMLEDLPKPGEERRASRISPSLLADYATILTSLPTILGDRWRENADGKLAGAVRFLMPKEDNVTGLAELARAVAALSSGPRTDLAEWLVEQIRAKAAQEQVRPGIFSWSKARDAEELALALQRIDRFVGRSSSHSAALAIGRILESAIGGERSKSAPGGLEVNTVKDAAFAFADLPGDLEPALREKLARELLEDVLARIPAQSSDGFYDFKLFHFFAALPEKLRRERSETFVRAVFAGLPRIVVWGDPYELEADFRSIFAPLSQAAATEVAARILKTVRPAQDSGNNRGGPEAPTTVYLMILEAVSDRIDSRVSSEVALAIGADLIDQGYYNRAWNTFASESREAPPRAGGLEQRHASFMQGAFHKLAGRTGGAGAFNLIGRILGRSDRVSNRRLARAGAAPLYAADQTISWFPFLAELAPNLDTAQAIDVLKMPTCIGNIQQLFFIGSYRSASADLWKYLEWLRLQRPDLYARAAPSPEISITGLLPGALLVICWIAYCLVLVRWPRVLAIMKSGGWPGMILLAVSLASVWGITTGPLIRVRGLALPSVIEKMLFVHLLAGLAALCGFVQVWYRGKRLPAK
jgi:hypothetical protein